MRNLLEAKPQRQHTPAYFAYQLLRIPSMVSLFCKARDFLGILKGRTNKKTIWSSWIQLLLLDPAIFDSEGFGKLYLEFELTSNDGHFAKLQYNLSWWAPNPQLMEVF